MPTTPVSRQPLPDNAEKVFSGIIFDVYQWQQPQFDGTLKTFEKLKRPDTVLIIPITPEGTILFTEEQQPGTEAVVRFAGGRVEEGEDYLEAARRELLEETGLEAGELVLVEAVQPVTKIDWSVYTCVARNCRRVAEKNLDAGERITLRELSFDEAVAFMARDDYPEREGGVVRLALRATYDPAKKEDLRRLLFGA